MPDLVAEPESQQVEKEQRQMGSMSLLQHLEELRQRVLRSVIAVGVCVGVGWYWVQPIISKMVAPIQKALADHHFDTSLIYLNPTDTFNIQLKIGLIVGIFIACPFLLYQVWGFISPDSIEMKRNSCCRSCFSLSVCLSVADTSDTGSCFR